MKKPFQIGERVRVFNGLEEFNGKIDSIGKSIPSDRDLIFVIEDGFYSCHNDAPFHPKQCRRLRKKEKPVVESVERWITHSTLGLGGPGQYETAHRSLASAQFATGNPLITPLHLVELKESEIIVSREELAMAWDQAAGKFWIKSDSGFFKAFCTALGIKAENEGGK